MALGLRKYFQCESIHESNAGSCNEKIGNLAKLYYLLFGFLVFQIFSPAVAAQQHLLDENMLTRTRPELDPLGVDANMGNFRVYPKLTYTALYDDNIFASESNTEADLISIISPAVSIRSNWGSHALDLLAVADIGNYSDFSGENYLDWAISADGRIDLRHNIQFLGGGNIGRQHVSRSSQDDISGLEPIKYDLASAYGRYSHQLGRFTTDLKAEAERKNFSDVLGTRNGIPVIINQDGRDRNEYTVRWHGGYKIFPERESVRHEVFVRMQGTRRDYDNLEDVTGYDRSSRGYEAVVGIALDLRGITSGDIFVGYRSQYYKNPFPDIKAPEVGVSINWNATKLTTVGIDLQRTIEETASAAFSGYVSTKRLVSIRHELRRNLLANIIFDRTANDYEGMATALRNDVLYSTGMGVTYLVNRYLYITIEYDHVQRDGFDNTVSPVNAAIFKKNLFFLRLQAQL